MILYPKKYLKKVTDIKVDFLKENNIKGIILDVDNTLIDFDKNLIEGINEWYKNIKENNIKCIILSNSSKVEKVKKVAESIGIPYIFFAKKPLKSGFEKAKKQLELDAHNIAVVGDQIFTDVLGANRVKMFSILVKPVAKKDLFLTRIKRPLENWIIKKYLKNKG